MWKLWAQIKVSENLGGSQKAKNKMDRGLRHENTNEERILNTTRRGKPKAKQIPQKNEKERKEPEKENELT